MRAGPGTGPARRITAPVAMPPPPAPPARHAVRPSRRVVGRSRPSRARPDLFVQARAAAEGRAIRPMLPFIRTTASLPSLAAHPRFRNPAPCAPRPLRASPARQASAPGPGGIAKSRAFRDEVLGLGLYVLGHASWAVRLGSWVLGLGPWAKQKAAGFHRRPNHVRVDWFGACTPLRTARTQQHPQGRKPIAWPSCSASGSPPWGASFGSLTRD